MVGNPTVRMRRPRFR